jgi:DNA-binding SARP family transcriptional activator/tetratricopeptide (TPR) repeat protein
MLGPLSAWHDGTPVQLGDQQQRFVLVVLLLHANRPVSADTLTDIVWGGNRARRDLVRNYIRRLREVFEVADDVAIDTTPTGYVLRVGDDQLDTVRFDRLRARAEDARAEQPRQAIELLRAAVELWHGRFLEDIDQDRVGGTDVVDPTDGYEDALGDLAELALEIGDHRLARDRLRPFVRANPDRQRHAELLMRALLLGGDRVAATRVFTATRDALDELGMEPGPVLRNLAARAERGEPASSLPPAPGSFTGRGDELATIEAAASERRPVWVSGAPGVGKTGLAIEAAHRLRQRFPDGQLIVRLNGFTPGVPALTVSEALTHLLGELGVPPEQIPATESRKATLYQDRLVGTRTLVVLDNAVSPDQVRPLLPEAPDCFVIVTSRHTGDPDTGEHVRLTPMPPEDAAKYFTVQTDPTRIRGRQAEVAKLVQLCRYLPGQIQVVAALFRRHSGWPLEHVLGLLEENGPWGDEDSSAAARVSYQQLDGPQQGMFRLLGHLPGPDLDVMGAAALAACAVPAARELLDDLHEVCLLEEVQTERYHMLDPLKEFAAAQGPAGDALVRLLDFYLVTLSAAVGAGYPFDRGQLPTTDRHSPVAPSFTDKDAALGWIAAERDNVVAAIRYAATHDLPGHAWRLAVLMWRDFNTASRLADWLDILELAWQIVFADEDNEYGQAHVLLRMAMARDRLGQLGEAMELAAKALPRWIKLGDAYGEAATLSALAIPTMELGRHHEAIALFGAALAKYDEIDDPRGRVHALSMLGYLNELHGNLEVALGQHEEAAAMVRETGDVRAMAHTLNNFGSVQQKLGLLTEALASYLEAHQHAIDAGDPAAEAYALNNLGNVNRLSGRLAEAVRYQAQAKKVAATVPDADLSAQLFLDRGATARARGDRAEALRACQAALDLADGTGNRDYQARAHHDIANLLHELGQHDRAVAHWDAAATGFVELELPEAAEVREQRAALACACGSVPL